MGLSSSKTISTNTSKSNDLINDLFKNNVVDSLDMTEYNTNKGGSSIPVIRVSHLHQQQLGGANLPVANKHSNEFINNMNKSRIFNLIHDTEIQEYHLNNMKKQGIFNNQDATNTTITTNTTMAGGYVPPTNPTNVNESDVSDAMNRIKEVIVKELNEQALNGGGNDNVSDSNTDGCGCGGNDKDKHSNKCEYGKKKKSKKGKSYESSLSEDSSSSSSSDSSSEEGAKNSNNGLSIFPFNSSDVSNKNYRLTRRKK
jgi:hypothetical protein